MHTVSLVTNVTFTHVTLSDVAIYRYAHTFAFEVSDHVPDVVELLKCMY